MRIKRVVIQGFKTFARRTDFVFDPGVTAVVGPNGSGKSNIVDAIRWCLGEQSFSLLRSRKTSDVIFAGSDKKARLNLAEVTITLDNSASEIPIDFAEVEISRRAYRDGDNEYLVNGQRVRLQDITELLSQTGLGKRTYSVVGQGLIDRALSMAPEERRSLFEEAAGITGYQIKRATAIRRLEATQQNLVRIQDIVAELSPRLGYLRRQADRAREREQIARDLQALLREWYGYRWHTTLKQLEEHHAAELQLRAEVDQRTGELTAVGTAIEEVRASQSELRGRLAVLHNQGSELHRQAEAAGREVAVTQERLRQLYARQEDNRRELAPLRVQQETLSGRLADLHAAVAAAEADLSGRQQAVEAVQLEVGQRQQERARLQEELDTARRAIKRIQEERADTASRLKQLDERRATILREQSDQQNAVAAAQQETATAEAELQRAETGSQALDQEAQRVREQLSALEQRVATRQAELRQAEESRQLADRALDRLQTRFDLLKRLSNEGAGYGSGVRAVLQASKAGRLQGIVGTVASQVHVPPHLDKAIETALGGALQNIVATSWHAATQAIEFLKAQRGGRATFLPLDRLNVLPAIPAPHARGILGNAVELVTFDPAVSEAVQQLLNRVWIAENLAAARAALDATGGPRPTVVTLEGEIIRPGGAVT
ncbi:MAG: AAA family ATPase, partial [Caldilineaceae bacterium]|nr:AAA family ATPase [Caldilineaceae bacterium]